MCCETKPKTVYSVRPSTFLRAYIQMTIHEFVGHPLVLGCAGGTKFVTVLSEVDVTQVVACEGHSPVIFITGPESWSTIAYLSSNSITISGHHPIVLSQVYYCPFQGTRYWQGGVSTLLKENQKKQGLPPACGRQAEAAGLNCSRTLIVRVAGGALCYTMAWAGRPRR